MKGETTLSTGSAKVERFIWLDLIRGVSAIAVCAWHLRNMMWVRREDIQNAGIGDAILYILTGMGHQSVMVFFVLSGFLVGGSILRQSFSWQHYTIARLSRLWVVLVPSLVFTILMDSLTTTRWKSYLGVGHDSSFGTFFGNVFFLQTIAVPVFGSNEPLWSLANEFWYYAIFPLLVSRSAALTSIGVLLVALLPQAIQLGFLVWLQGVVAYLFVSRARLRHRIMASRLAVLFLLFFAAALLYSKSPTLQSHVKISADLIVGGTFALVCISLPERLPILSSVARRISDMSYSLYLTHFPMVVLIGAYFYPVKTVPTFNLVLQFMVWMCVLLLVGFTFWWLFERHTDYIRRRVVGFLTIARA